MQITLERLAEPIKAIHATPPMMVIEFAGAGAQALTWLHGAGGSSRTMLEATDRYAAASLIEAIGFEPEQFTSPQVARAMATRAYIRANHLTDYDIPVAGIGCTATITTDRIKRGDHRCCVAVCDAQGVTTYTLTLTKGLRSRQEEENLVSLLILKAVAGVCDVEGLPEPDLASGEVLGQQVEPIDWPARLLAQEIDWVTVLPDGRMVPGASWADSGVHRRGLALLSGAFNPLHDGHKQLARVAAEILGQEVYFELPLVNADKASLDLAEARRRVAQFANWTSVILTRVPLFSQKATLFPGSVFIVGVDTVERLVQLRFYHNDPTEMYASFKALRTAGCRFLVAGRRGDHHFFTLRDVELPAGYRELFEEIPEERFRMDISSTIIRDRNKN